MKSVRGKIIMAAIILSCGFVMQAEKASEQQRMQHDEGPRGNELAYNASEPDTTRNDSTLAAGRSSW